jgi:hypothetical protein
MGELEVRLMDATPSLPPANEEIRYSRAWLAMRGAAKRDAREERIHWIAICANIIATIAAAAAIAAAIIAYSAYSSGIK